MICTIPFKCVIPSCYNERYLYNAYCSTQCELLDINHKYACDNNLFEVDGFYGPPWPIGFSQDSLRDYSTVECHNDNDIVYNKNEIDDNQYNFDSEKSYYHNNKRFKRKDDDNHQISRSRDNDINKIILFDDNIHDDGQIKNDGKNEHDNDFPDSHKYDHHDNKNIEKARLDFDHHNDDVNNNYQFNRNDDRHDEYNCNHNNDCHCNRNYCSGKYTNRLNNRNVNKIHQNDRKLIYNHYNSNNYYSSNRIDEYKDYHKDKVPYDLSDNIDDDDDNNNDMIKTTCLPLLNINSTTATSVAVTSLLSSSVPSLFVPSTIIAKKASCCINNNCNHNHNNNIIDDDFWQSSKPLQKNKKLIQVSIRKALNNHQRL